MRIRLQYKLFAAILAASMVVVIYMTITMQWSFDRGFRHYVSAMEYEQLKTVAAGMEKLYGTYGGWEPLREHKKLVIEAVVASYPEGNFKERLQKRLRESGSAEWLPSGPLPEDLPRHFLPRLYLLDVRYQTIFGFDPREPGKELLDLFHDNRVVGHIGLHPGRPPLEEGQLVFARHQRWALMMVAAAAVLIAAGLTLPITYMLTRPIRAMAGVARSLAAGRYRARVQIDSHDELGQLAQDINDLGAILEKNQTARSQWIADISHELRTPLSILRGKIEALQDGVYQPGQELYSDLHREVMHLGLLVDDLYQLSLSDLGAMSYTRMEVEPCWALEQALSMLMPEIINRELHVEKTIDLDDDITLFGDNERLKQLFLNLLNNGVRYTDRGGTLRIQVTNEKTEVVYTIEDSPPGVSDTDLDHLFERLYRVENSRSRELGGAGLGLSICHAIVMGHHGTIAAEHSSLGGLLVRVRLPQADYLEQP